MMWGVVELIWLEIAVLAQTPIERLDVRCGFFGIV